MKNDLFLKALKGTEAVVDEDNPPNPKQMKELKLQAKQYYLALCYGKTEILEKFWSQ